MSILAEAVRKFYYGMTLNELRRMHSSTVFPNISYNSLLYLDLIDMTPECTVSRLAELLHISKPGATAKVGELIRRGLVDRQQSVSDKRVFYLSVNQEAAAEYKSYEKSAARAAETTEARFSAQEMQSFCAILADFSREYMKEESQ